MPNSNDWYRKPGDGRTWLFQAPLGIKLRVQEYCGSWHYNFKAPTGFVCGAPGTNFNVEEAKRECLLTLRTYYGHQITAWQDALNKLQEVLDG